MKDLFGPPTTYRITFEGPVSFRCLDLALQAAGIDDRRWRSDAKELTVSTSKYHLETAMRLLGHMEKDVSFKVTDVDGRPVQVRLEDE